MNSKDTKMFHLLYSSLYSVTVQFSFSIWLLGKIFWFAYLILYVVFKQFWSTDVEVVNNYFGIVWKEKHN